MRSLSFILLIFIAASCGTQKFTQEAYELKDGELRGTVILLPKRSDEGLQAENEYYFRTDSLNYFVKLSESAVSVDELKKKVDKPIVIKGVIKNGAWEPDKPGSISTSETPKKGRSGMYITIEKIVK